MNLKNLRQTALKTAEKQARDSSDKNRNFYIAYLALSFYVLVMAAGVDDKELLLDQRELSIPLLSLGLKPSIWFIITPIALFVVYLDLILNLNEHLRKLLAWREANGSKLPPKQVQPFVVDFAFAHQGRGFWGTLYHFMLWLSVAMFAPLALIVCLLKFGHYQSMAISGLHLVLLLLSLILTGQFMRHWRHKVLLLPFGTIQSSRWQTFVNGLWRWLKRTCHTETICLLLTVASLGYADLLYGFASGQSPEWFQQNQPWIYGYW